MSSFHLSYIGANTRGSWAEESDDRWLADTTRGLFYVADASGPTYGGYHAPFAVDPGIEQLVRSFDGAQGEPETLLLRAFEGANREMARLYETFVTLRGKQIGLGPSLAAADQVRPHRWAHLSGRSYAHFTTSLTALLIRENKFVVTQVGSSRAYLRRQDQVYLLLPDHTIPTLWAAFGRATAQEMEHHRKAVGRLLGVSEGLQVDQTIGWSKEGDTFLLCSDGVWHGEVTDDSLRELTSPDMTQEKLSQSVSEYANKTRDDATAVLVRLI